MFTTVPMFGLSKIAIRWMGFVLNSFGSHALCIRFTWYLFAILIVLHYFNPLDPFKHYLIGMAGIKICSECTAVKQGLQCVKNMVPHLGCLVWYWEKIVFQHICRPSVAGLHTGTELGSIWLALNYNLHVLSDKSLMQDVTLLNPHLSSSVSS